MIIYNTTFHADKSIDKEFIEWIRREYIPKALAGGILAEPRLTRVFDTEATTADKAIHCNSARIVRRTFTLV